MPESLQDFHDHVGEDGGLGQDAAAGSGEPVEGRARAGMDGAPALTFNSNEAAARYSSVRQRPHDSPVLPPALS